MEKIPKDQIVAGLFQYFDDFDFIVKINELTYSRKVQLSKKNNTYFTKKDDTNKKD